MPPPRLDPSFRRDGIEAELGLSGAFGIALDYRASVPDGLMFYLSLEESPDFVGDPAFDREIQSLL